MSPGPPNADPISDQKMSFFTPVFRPGRLKSIPVFRSRLETHEIDLDWNANKKNVLKSTSNSRISLSFLSSFGIEMINVFIHSRSFLENHARLQTKTGKVYTRFSYGL